MIVYFLIVVVLTMSVCGLLYRYLSQQVLQLNIKLDDGRGFFLIGILLVAFVSTVLAYYLGGVFGFTADEVYQGQMVLVLLLNVLTALLVLIYGLIHFKAGERY